MLTLHLANSPLAEIITKLSKTKSLKKPEVDQVFQSESSLSVFGTKFINECLFLVLFKF